LSLELACQFKPAAIDTRLHCALGELQLIGNFLIRQLLQVAKHHRGAKRGRQRLECHLQLGPQILVLGEGVRRPFP
jgi:hypothetical protein